jgi:hypothetical protein
MAALTAVAALKASSQDDSSTAAEASNASLRRAVLLLLSPLLIALVLGCMCYQHARMQGWDAPTDEETASLVQASFTHCCTRAVCSS